MGSVADIMIVYSFRSEQYLAQKLSNQHRCFAASVFSPFQTERERERERERSPGEVPCTCLPLGGLCVMLAMGLGVCVLFRYGSEAVERTSLPTGPGYGLGRLASNNTRTTCTATCHTGQSMEKEIGHRSIGNTLHIYHTGCLDEASGQTECSVFIGVRGISYNYKTQHGSNMLCIRPLCEWDGTQFIHNCQVHTVPDSGSLCTMLASLFLVEG